MLHSVVIFNNCCNELFQNATFSCDQQLRMQVMTSLDRDDHLFRLLSDSEIDIVMKMLGLLRNLLSSKAVSEYHRPVNIIGQ